MSREVIGSFKKPKTGEDEARIQAVLHTHARAKDQRTELGLVMAEAQQFGLRCCDGLMALAMFYGAYDIVAAVPSIMLEGRFPGQLSSILIIRYAVLLPLLLLRTAARVNTPQTHQHTSIVAALLVAFPALAVTVILLMTVFFTHGDVLPCPTADGTAIMYPSCANRSSGERFCWVQELDGVNYCEGPAVAYATTLLMLHGFLPYVFIFAQLPLLIIASLIGSAAGLTAFIVSHLSLTNATGLGLPLTEWYAMPSLAEPGVVHTTSEGRPYALVSLRDHAPI